MGGYGSGRWGSHIKKTTVEDGYKLSIGVVSDCEGFRQRIEALKKRLREGPEPGAE